MQKTLIVFVALGRTKGAIKNKRLASKKWQSNSFLSVNTEAQNIIKEAGVVAKNIFAE